MDPADPHNLHDTADHAIMETIRIATDGNDCEACIEQIREPLMEVNGVHDVRVDEDLHAVFVTFDARKIQNAGVLEAIERTGYKPAPFAEQ
ncbi:MAG: heavy-metal-associated domain-containing protein [Verrucomicrobiota bacterium]|nr:heavy-metal-associated domain-containing protein [Verrucomicrobiota bacterium]